MPDDKRPDWFGLELGVEVDGQRIDLLPALLDLLDTAGDLATLVRPARRCIAVRVDDKRWLPVPPARLRMLAKVLLELYRDGGKLRAPVLRAPLIADLCGALHDPDRPVRWVGDTRIREQAFAMALGPRRGGTDRAARRAVRRAPAVPAATAWPGSSTCARTTPAACSPTTWASARRCRPSRTSCSRSSTAGSIARRWS